MGRKRISVTSENKTGRNKQFRDNYSKRSMSRSEFVTQIKNGKYENYHVRNVHGKDTPVSNPDKTRNNNLG